MKICLLGETRGNMDEGMRNISYLIARHLEVKHELLFLDLRDILSIGFWREIRVFNPDIIHYLHGPTIKSFVITKTLAIYSGCPKTIMSAMRPIILRPFAWLLLLFKPNIILTQSSESESLFQRWGVKTKFFPSGVDVNRFAPVSGCEKKQLRKKYNLDEDGFYILHVGSIKEGRNITFLQQFQGNGNNIIIIGAGNSVDPQIYDSLSKSGCTVILKYIEDIQEIYNLSDCYIYPTVVSYDLLGRATADSIEMPLTVLEAMACNLPVITTRFGALPRIFESGDGLYFIQTSEEVNDAITRIKSGAVSKTREKVMAVSHENIMAQLEDIYEQIYHA